MTECLENEVAKNNTRVFDGMAAVKLIVKNNKIAGILAIDTQSANEGRGLTLFNCENVVLATGGPAGIYDDSVYPLCHTGMSGLAVEAGAKLNNLQEWQYGMAAKEIQMECFRHISAGDTQIYFCRQTGDSNRIPVCIL